MGFYHEQNRSDRDEHIEVNLANVKPGHEGNFAIFPSKNNVTYDYNSVMHYGRTVNMHKFCSFGMQNTSKLRF